MPILEDILEQLKEINAKLTPKITGTVNTPDRKFKIWKTVKIGGRTKEELLKDLNKQKINVSDYAKAMIESGEFSTQKKEENVALVRLTVGDLFGDQNVHTTDDIYKKADQFGLDLCPAEVGPHLRLKLTEQPIGDWFYIAMKQIAFPDRNPFVFDLGRIEDGLWLDDHWAEPTNEWNPRNVFVFRLRK